MLGHAGFQPQPCHQSQLTGCDPLPVPGLLGAGRAPWGPPGPRSVGARSVGGHIVKCGVSSVWGGEGCRPGRGIQALRAGLQVRASLETGAA